MQYYCYICDKPHDEQFSIRFFSDEIIHHVQVCQRCIDSPRNHALFTPIIDKETEEEVGQRLAIRGMTFKRLF